MNKSYLLLLGMFIIIFTSCSSRNEFDAKSYPAMVTKVEVKPISIYLQCQYTVVDEYGECSVSKDELLSLLSTKKYRNRE